MKKDLAIIFGLFIVIAVIVVFGKGFSTFNFFSQTASTQEAKPQNRKETLIRIKDLSITAKIAANSKDRQKGLSKLESLPLDQGELFVFDKSDKYEIWMKDMKFAIDIIWIDQDKRIVDIASNIPPEPGKKDQELQRYQPKQEAKYILEINAGLASLHNLQVGDQLSFEI